MVASASVWCHEKAVGLILQWLYGSVAVLKSDWATHLKGRIFLWLVGVISVKVLLSEVVT